MKVMINDDDDADDDDMMFFFGCFGAGSQMVASWVVVDGWSLNSSTPPPKNRLSEVRFNLESLP